jgi:hypothetical protein
MNLQLGTLYHIREVTFQRFNGNGYVNLQTTSSLSSLDLSSLDEAPHQGVNVYRAQVRLDNGGIVYSDPAQVYFLPNQPVVIYPVPAGQGQPINILVKDQGVYSIRIMDAGGRWIRSIELNDIVNNIAPFTLPKGLYFVQVTTADKNLFVQKIVVY